MRWLLPSVLALSACNRPSTESPDVSPDVSPTSVCVGDPSGFLPMTCFDPPPPPRTFGPAFDTGTDVCDRTVDTSDPPLCIVVTSTVTGILDVIGARALVLWSPDTLSISGTIDLASH